MACIFSTANTVGGSDIISVRRKPSKRKLHVYHVLHDLIHKSEFQVLLTVRFNYGCVTIPDITGMASLLHRLSFLLWQSAVHGPCEFPPSRPKIRKQMCSTFWCLVPKQQCRMPSPHSYATLDTSHHRSCQSSALVIEFSLSFSTYLLSCILSHHGCTPGKMLHVKANCW